LTNMLNSLAISKLEFGGVRLGPRDQAHQRWNERLGQRCQRVIDTRRHRRVDGSDHKALLERPVRYVPLDDDAYRGALLSAGLPDWYADGLAELYRFYRAGKGAIVTDAVERVTGRPAGTFDAYLADHRTLFE
jgi:hypothetical protein